jgi:hypothetical protein
LIVRACIRGWLAADTGSFRCGWGAEGRRGIDIWAGMGYFNRAGCDGQRYRSGHNGAGSKSARSTPLAKPANPHGAGLPEQEAAGKFSETLTICSQFSKSSFSACAVKRYRQRYRSGYNGPDSKSCYLCLKLNNYTVETYRSGHNEPDSKSGSPQGLVGSNPTVSATKALKTLRFQGFFLASCGALFRWIF